MLCRATPGVYFGVMDDEAVLLDLVRDRYLGLTRPSTQIWIAAANTGSLDAASKRVTSSGSGEAGDDFQIPLTMARDIIRRQVDIWEQVGLVRRGDDLSPPTVALRLPSPRTVPAASHALTVAEAGRSSLSALAFPLLAGAAMSCSLALRCAGLPSALRGVQRIPAGRCRNGISTLARIAATLRAHTLLRRPFAQGRRDCLPRCIVLAAALRLQGVDACICLGVTKFPFLAHAWVQVDHLVVGDTLATVGRFVRIAAF